MKDDNNNVTYLKEVCKDVVDLSNEAIVRFVSIADAKHAKKKTKEEMVKFQEAVAGYVTSAEKTLTECEGLVATAANNMALLNRYTEMTNYLSNIKYYFNEAVKLNEADREDAKVK